MKFKGKNHPKSCRTLLAPSADNRKIIQLQYFLKIISCQQEHPNENTQVPSSDVITSLCGYSPVSEA